MVGIERKRDRQRERERETERPVAYLGGKSSFGGKAVESDPATNHHKTSVAAYHFVMFS